MRRRDIYIFSSQNGATTWFKKSFHSSYDPPTTNDIVLLGMIGEPRGIIKEGVVRRVRVTETSDEVTVETDDASTSELRQCLIPDGWVELPKPSGEN